MHLLTTMLLSAISTWRFNIEVSVLNKDYQTLLVEWEPECCAGASTIFGDNGCCRLVFIILVMSRRI